MARNRVVVGMLTHRDPDQVIRVVDRLVQDSRVTVIVHHDPTGPRLLPSHERMRVLATASPAPWGSMGVARAQLKVVRAAAETVPDAEWLVLISGADYPAMHPTRMVDLLMESRRDAYVRWFRSDLPPSEDVHPWQARTRSRYMRRLRLPGTHRSMPFPRRHPFRGGTGLYVGDLWVNLNRNSMEHVLRQLEQRPELVRYFSRCSVPDEALLPTLLLNGSETLDVEADHRRYIRWRQGSPHPETVTEADVPQILASGAFFARKMDPSLSGAAMDALDEAISPPPG